MTALIVAVKVTAWPSTDGFGVEETLVVVPNITPMAAKAPGA